MGNRCCANSPDENDVTIAPTRDAGNEFEFASPSSPPQQALQKKTVAAAEAQSVESSSASTSASVAQGRPVGQPQPPRAAVFIVGGDSRTEPQSKVTAEVFDVASRKFVELPPLIAPHGPYSAAAAAAGKLYIFGGSSHSEAVDTCSRFDPDTWTWELMAPMPTPRMACTAVNVAGNIFVCGGAQGGTVSTVDKMATVDTMNDLDIVEQFDPRTNVWKSMTPMSSVRSYCASASAELMLYVLGGCSSRGKCALSVCERFAPRHKRWELVAPLNTPRHSCAATTLKDTLFVYGGNDGTDDLRSGELHSPGANSWTMMPTPLPSPRANCLMVGIVGELYVFGGHSSSGSLDSGERLDARGDQLECLPNMLAKRSWCVGASWTQSERTKIRKVDIEPDVPHGSSPS